MLIVGSHMSAFYVHETCLYWVPYCSLLCAGNVFILGPTCQPLFELNISMLGPTCQPLFELNICIYIGLFFRAESAVLTLPTLLVAAAVYLGPTCQPLFELNVSILGLTCQPLFKLNMCIYIGL